ncbi:MAG: hypothetical protein J4F46_00390 [Dehalococcoidia bacterium]|nr:hypothetical protein [Dehalococcoidia bacterium]
MSVLIGVLLALLAIAVVIYPFVRARFQPRPPMTVVSPDPGRLDTVYEEIRTLQLEYELGSIDEREYQEQLRDYRLQAAAILHEQGRSRHEIDLLMEEEIMAARGALRNQVGSLEEKRDDHPI